MKFVHGQKKWSGIFFIIIICLLGVQLEYNQGFAYLSYIEDARFYVAQNSADEGSPPGASDEIRETAFFKALVANEDSSSCFNAVNSRMAFETAKTRRGSPFRWFGLSVLAVLSAFCALKKEEGHIRGRERPTVSSLEKMIAYIHHQDGEKAGAILLLFLKKLEMIGESCNERNYFCNYNCGSTDWNFRLELVA